MAKTNHSVKKQQLIKANSSMVVIVGVTAFIAVFCLVASKALWTKMNYQNRVISAKEEARDQSRENIAASDELIKSYNAFVATDNNVIGGRSEGKGDKDGDNAQIILDALPSQYDFPGLTTSLEKIIKDNNGTDIQSISGTDDEVTQSAKDDNVNNPIEMPFELTASGNYDAVSNLISLFDRSIRPIYIGQLKLSGSNSELEIAITGKSYYQPARTLEIQKKVVK